ncbi:tetratricopeptide repeat protein [Amycolatopsis sp. cmx-8-4]|uniref:tetratricopeptide repeat protein n=1 Tax=Amycolatopsis sp. cmx-8-4 TaxID=2790947 RepID=UPI0039780D66
MPADPRIPGYLGRVLTAAGLPVGTCFQVAPMVLVTAWHVLNDLDCGAEDDAVDVDALNGALQVTKARVLRTDLLRDLAVLRADAPLQRSVTGWFATDRVPLNEPVVVTGVSHVDDPGHELEYLDAPGEWAGGTTRDSEVPLGRLSAKDVMRGMSGAPVRRRSDDHVVGVVSARYNSGDGWLAHSVWVARSEDVRRLLAGIEDVTFERRPDPVEAADEGDARPSGRRVEWPYRCGVVPPRADALQVRATGGWAADAVGAGEAAVSTSVLSGMGGVGKTQLAADHAETAWAAGDLDLLVWITAASRDAILSTYTRVAADLTGVDEPDPEQGAQRLLSWLVNASKRWLIVLDDVQSPGDLRGLWPPATSWGRVVVTTRRRDAALRGRHRRLIEVDVFSDAEAATYLSAALADHPDLIEGATGLAWALGCLPLALAQAAAFMLDRQLSCLTYHARLADRLRRLRSLLPEAESLPDEHQATVAATWSLSVEQANRLEPAGLAGVLLEIVSLLDPNGVPAVVFTAAPVLQWLGDTVGRPVGEDDARDGLACLHRLSLITWKPDSALRAVRAHALVQRATRDSLPQARLAVLARAVADALVSVWPDIETDTVLGQVLRANADALSAAGDACLWEPAAHPLLFRAGTSLGESGSAAQATSYFQRLRATAVRRLGPDHPDALDSRHSLARWRGEAGDPGGAAAALKELLADRVRVLGAEHPHAVATRHSLTRWLGEAGDPAGAAAVSEELLADHLRVSGAEHPSTLATRHHLAYWRGEAGDPAGAAAALEELLIDLVRVLGADHPNTLIARQSLARWRGEAGDPAGAVVALKELLADRRQVLGADHPDTLATRHHLAQWQGEAGDPASAAIAFAELLTDRLRVLGADHPDTLATRHHLAQWRNRLSKSVPT